MLIGDSAQGRRTRDVRAVKVLSCLKESGSRRGPTQEQNTITAKMQREPSHPQNRPGQTLIVSQSFGDEEHLR